MSYGLNVEMHKQVRDLIIENFYKWLDTAGVLIIERDFVEMVYFVSSKRKTFFFAL